MEAARAFAALVSALAAIDLIAASGGDITSCQRGIREQQMRRGYKHKFYRGPARNQILHGHSYLNVTTGSYLTCAGMCLRDDVCKSFNFCQDVQRCELNSAVFKNMTDLCFSRGCQYFDEDYHEPETEELLATCLSPEPLGLEDATILDSYMSASSAYSLYAASEARLNNGGCWAPASNEGSWIQIDLDVGTILSGITVQGWHSYYVTEYRVSYTTPSSPAFQLVTYINGSIQIFSGNVDGTTPVTNMFHQSIIASAVRIEPLAWVYGVGMRLELHGCRT